MRAGPRRCRRDANHAAIVAELRQAGVEVIDMAAYGAPFDLLVRRNWWPRGLWIAIEVKVSARARLTEAERGMVAAGDVLVALDTEDVLRHMGERIP